MNPDRFDDGHGGSPDPAFDPLVTDPELHAATAITHRRLCSIKAKSAQDCFKLLLRPYRFY
jgi:hypothetical protein